MALWASPLADIFPTSSSAVQGERKKEHGVEEFDLRGLKCPLPALVARRKLAALAPGQTIWVLANDPLSVVDIPHMCVKEGHDLIESARAADHHRFLIRRGT
jgi:tRNA 2-thiouridine synthesizing protein A